MSSTKRKFALLKEIAQKEKSIQILNPKGLEKVKAGKNSGSNKPLN